MVQWLICDHQINCRCENNTTNGLSVRKARPLIEYTDASINSLLLVGLQVPKWDVSLIVIYTAAAESRSAYFFGNCPQTIISLYRRRIVRNAPCIHCGMWKILDVGIRCLFTMLVYLRCRPPSQQNAINPALLISLGRGFRQVIDSSSGRLLELRTQKIMR